MKVVRVAGVEPTMKNPHKPHKHLANKGRNPLSMNRLSLTLNRSKQPENAQRFLKVLEFMKTKNPPWCAGPVPSVAGMLKETGDVLRVNYSLSKLGWIGTEPSSSPENWKQVPELHRRSSRYERAEIATSPTWSEYLTPLYPQSIVEKLALPCLLDVMSF